MYYLLVSYVTQKAQNATDENKCVFLSWKFYCRIWKNILKSELSWAMVKKD